YYEFPRKPQARFRGLMARDPLFVRYVRRHLLPQIRGSEALRGLRKYFDGELDGTSDDAGELAVEPVEAIPGIGGVVLHKASALRISGPLSLRSSRVTGEGAPLVLAPSLPQTTYYNHVPLPRPWVLDPVEHRDRTQLPHTHVRHPWIHPVEDFL